jgi:hypothetical protein
MCYITFDLLPKLQRDLFHVFQLFCSKTKISLISYFIRLFALHIDKNFIEFNVFLLFVDKYFIRFDGSI